MFESGQPIVFEQTYSGPPAALDDAQQAVVGAGLLAAPVDCPYTDDGGELAHGWLVVRSPSGVDPDIDAQLAWMTAVADALNPLGFDLRIHGVATDPEGA